MCPPTGIYPFITTIWHAFNQSINVIWGMFAHSSTIVVLGPLTVFGGCSRPWICLLIMSQQCSIGFRSGEQAGQSMASMPSSPRQSIETPAVCGRALSLSPIAAENDLAIGSSTSLGRRMCSYVRLPQQISAEH